MSRLISPAGFWFLGSLLLVTPQPGALWYKHSASPRYHTVGRASGLLIGVRRSPYLWRRDVPVGQQAAKEKAEVIYGLWRGAGTDHQLYPDPGEKSTLLEKLYRNLEEERDLGDDKEIVHNGENIEGARLSFNKFGEEKRHFEDQSWLAGRLDLVERSLGENKLMFIEPTPKSEMGLERKRLMVKDLARVQQHLKGNNLLVMEPGEEKRMQEQTWLNNDPGEEPQSLQGNEWMFTEPLDEARSLDRETRREQESRAPNTEDILAMYLQKYQHGASRAYPHLWRRHLPGDKQLFFPGSKALELNNCEDLTWTSHKILCKSILLSHSLSDPGRQNYKIEDPTIPL
ncbi:neuropeptide W [Pyxicephalus adspersus]|uniref:neuropeptide W n=1 Tax=Pyxicephalus adspersus TaxID=30357 RepID=UPI003B5BD8BE